MAKWNEYGLKSGTAAEDEVLILDSDTNTNKRTTVGDIQEFANGKMLEKENSMLNTEAKDLIGAINEVDAKNDAHDEKISALESGVDEAKTKNTEQDKRLEAVEEKFPGYLKKTDVDSTLSVSGSPADAKVVGEQFRKSEEAITDLADKKITKFYASNQGNTHLPDSDKGKIQDMFLYGKSEQVQYKGKNLLNVTAKTQTVNGVTFTVNEDGTVKVNGTATALTSFSLTGGSVENTFVGKKVVGCPSGGSTSGYTLAIAYYNSDKQWQTEEFETYSNSIIIKDYARMSPNIRIQSGVTVNNLIFKPMLTTDTTATYADYEPYTGGIPSPNPDYPQEIKAVINPKVVVRGKNLYDSEKYQLIFNKALNMDTGAIYTTQSGKYYCVEEYIPFPYGGKKISFSNLSSLCAYDKGYNFISLITQNERTVPLGTMYIRFDVKKEYKDVVQIELSENATPYEAYTEQSTTLPYTLYAIPVTTGGNISICGKQYVADYVDVERGKLVRMCKYKKFLSTDIDTIGTDKSLIVLTDKIWDIKDNYTKRSLNALCTIGIATLETVADAGWKGKGKLKIKNVQFTNEDEAINYFNNHNVYGCYPIPTPEEIDLTPDQIQAFKSLSTNYPVTNIEVSSDQLDGYTVFNYPISMAEGWNYVKQQIGDTRDYIYDMDLQSAEAYVNSEYAVALAELEVM